MAETERINKAELYKRKVGTPQLTSSDIERIKDIRQKRYKQEQIRKLKREAKPIKKQNISKINQEINKYHDLFSEIYK